VTCTHNGNVVMTALWGVAISKDPYLSFRFKGAKAGDKFALSWVDNKGEKDSAEAVIE
jgi:sulfur-oxidizing protein SoxZ